MPTQSTPEAVELVTLMCNLMLDQLSTEENQAKGGWTGVPSAFLHNGLQRNLIALEKLPVTENNKPEIVRRCVNIANFAGMIAQRYAPKEG